MADQTTHITQIEASQAQKEVTANDLFDAASVAMHGARRAEACSGLVWGYYGGRWGGDTVANGTLTLTASDINYIVCDRLTGEILLDTASSSDDLWGLPDDYARLYEVATDGSAVTSYEDHRAGPDGIFDVPFGYLQGDGTDVAAVGFRGVPQNAQTGNYSIVAADAGKHIHHASGAGSGDTYTLPSNASVPFDIGTAITFTNLDSNAVSIAIDSDTLRLADLGTTGTRSLAQYGVATALKVEATVWLISGVGLS